MKDKIHTHVKYLVIVAVVLFAGVMVFIPWKLIPSLTEAGKMEVTNCSSFKTQPEAQKFYDLFIKSDVPEFRAMAQRLDSLRDDDNGDGNNGGVGELACEHLSRYIIYGMDNK